VFWRLLQGTLIITECAQIYGQNVRKFVAPTQTRIWYISNRRGLSASSCTKTLRRLPPPWGYAGSPQHLGPFHLYNMLPRSPGLTMLTDSNFRCL